MSNWNAGEKFEVRDNQLTRNCLIAGKSGWVTHVRGGMVSFSIETAAVTIKARCSLETCGINFRKVPFAAISEYHKSNTDHFRKKFPEDFLG